MHDAKPFKFAFMSLTIAVAVAGGSLGIVRAQETSTSAPAKKDQKKDVKKPVSTGRDPFKRYETPVAPVVVIKKSEVVTPPFLQDRIEQYRAQKLAAMNAHVTAPKPTTALLLDEVQVIGISRTPRGYAAIIEARPIKLSYVIYPGERLYDGQLVAIEDSHLVFRRETVWSDGRRDRTVEIKALRKPTIVDAMTAAKPAPAVEPAKKPEEKAPPTDKP